MLSKDSSNPIDLQNDAIIGPIIVPLQSFISPRRVNVFPPLLATGAPSLVGPPLLELQAHYHAQQALDIAT